MKLKIIFTFCLLALVFAGYSGEPVPGAEVYIEQVKNGELIALHQTGKSGLVTFTNLNKGVYNLIVVLPKQKGKFASGRGKTNSNLKVGYHSNKKMYFLQEPQGYFTFKFSGLKKLTDSNISPMYEKGKKRDNKTGVVVAKFEVKGNPGSIR